MTVIFRFFGTLATKLLSQFIFLLKTGMFPLSSRIDVIKSKNAVRYSQIVFLHISFRKMILAASYVCLVKTNRSIQANRNTPHDVGAVW